MEIQNNTLFAIACFCFGIWAFFKGFEYLRRKRLIENIPTSTIRSLALGLVELYGKAEREHLLKSPLTKTECVLFKYLIEEYRRSGKSGKWVTIASGDSFSLPFWLNDGTGRIMVYPQGADLMLPVDYEFNTRIEKKIPDNLIEFMKENGISWGYRSLRFSEWFIKPGENVYVLGSAQKIDISDLSLYRNTLAKRIEELRGNQQKMKEIDLNKDGEISEEEWDSAIAKIEEKLFAEILNDSQLHNTMDVIIGKGEVEKIFIISDSSEKELREQFLFRALLSIYGGALLSLVSLTYLLFKFKKGGS